MRVKRQDAPKPLDGPTLRDLGADTEPIWPLDIDGEILATQRPTMASAMCLYRRCRAYLGAEEMRAAEARYSHPMQVPLFIKRLLEEGDLDTPVIEL